MSFFDEGNVVGMGITRAGNSGHGESSAVWRGAGRVFGDVLEWRVGVDGVPVAAILRTWERNEADSVVEALRVFTVSNGSACEYGTIPGRRRDANIMAAALAEKSCIYRVLPQMTGSSAMREIQA